MDAAGTALAGNAHSQNVDEALAEFRSGALSYYQVDGLGSVTSLTNSSATIAVTYAYGAFGNLSASMGSITNPFRYAGRESDQETGLYYYRARYYSPDTGRFVNEDPLGLSVGVNVYEYVRNNPIDNIDPLGLYAYCFFNQIRGGIICYSDSGESMGDPNAYSGYGSAANNPAWATWYGVGVIPEGDYWIGPGHDGDKGKPQFNLTPVKDPFMHKPDMAFHDANSYLIHADSQNHPGPHEASEGCIVTNLRLRRWLAKQGGGMTTVYNPQHFLYPLDRFLSNPLALP